MIKKAIDQLTSCAERKEIEDALRHIAEIVLKDYILKFGETFVQLIEIEMYYYNESCYKDTAIHTLKFFFPFHIRSNCIQTH